MQRLMFVVRSKNKEKKEYLRIVTRVKDGKAEHTASWVEDITYANRFPNNEAAQMAFLCSHKKLNTDYCFIVEVLVSVTEVE